MLLLRAPQSVPGFALRRAEGRGTATRIGGDLREVAIACRAGGRIARAQPAAASDSRSVITANMSRGRPGSGRATTAPRRGQVSTSPLDSSRRSASRTGVRETPCCAASGISSSGVPGGSWPATIASASLWARRAARVCAAT